MQVRWRKTFLLEYLKDLNAFVKNETYGSVVRNDKGYSRERWKLLQDLLYWTKPLLLIIHCIPQCHICYMHVFLNTYEFCTLFITYSNKAPVEAHTHKMSSFLQPWPWISLLQQSALQLYAFLWLEIWNIHVGTVPGEQCGCPLPPTSQWSVTQCHMSRWRRRGEGVSKPLARHAEFI